MGFISDDLTPKRPATAVVPVTNFPSDGGNAEKPEVATAQATEAQPEKNTAIDTTGITGNDGKDSFVQQPTEDVTKVEPNQGIKIDWSRPYSEIEQNPILQQMKPYDIMRDYQKNGDGNWAAFMPWLSQFDADKTVAANEAMRKKAERQAKMEQWSNFFMHLGNFFGTTQGAPSQKIESAQELTDRQRKLREGTDALRQKGYDQMMVNIWKDRQNKQAQMQAEAAAKANEALAEYRASQKNQTDALTPVKVEEVTQSARQHSTGADLNVSKKETEDALRGKKGKLLDNQADAAAAKAADSHSHVAVNNSTTARNNAATNKTIRTTPKYSQAEYGKRFIKYFNHMKKNGGNNLASIYEKKYGIGKNGDTGKQWDASLQRMFVDDVEEQGLAPKSLGIGIGSKSNNGKTNKGKHLNL